jgi:hypothetical protein
MEKEIGELEHYRRYLMGEDYQPIPKITVKTIEIILNKFNKLDVKKQLKEAVKEAAKRFPLQEERGINEQVINEQQLLAREAFVYGVHYYIEK